MIWQTTRRRDRTGNRILYLDLAEDKRLWRLPDDRIDVAFLCAAVTSMQKCEDEPDATQRVNVNGTVTVGERMALQGAFLVFLSTNAVFDGEKPFAAPVDPVNPKSQYGKQKADAEKRLLALGSRVAIARLGKVIDPHAPLFQGWIEDLKAGKIIHPFSNMVFAPVSLAAVTRFLTEIARERRGGIFHLTGPEDITYADAARFIAKRIDVAETFVQPVRHKSEAISFAPRHAALTCNPLSQNRGLVGMEALTTLAGLKE